MIFINESGGHRFDMGFLVLIKGIKENTVDLLLPFDLCWLGLVATT